MCECYYIASFFPWRCSIRYLWHSRTYSHRFCIWLWRIFQRTRKTFIRNNIIWRYHLPGVWYVQKIPFSMLWNSKKYTMKTFLRLVMYIKRLCFNVCSIFPYNTRKKLHAYMWYWRFCTCCNFIWCGQIAVFVYQVSYW